ncbi:MAG: hypothetical protein A2W26_01440 [Acidobacteria bacterium RBG_16_64_8]|nr:MAG: hypothetical protein A2W26_01440 [Acidobacteria bacterium RBG_16_64_8]
MPRRYHRPPAAKRRKAKKTSIPYAFEAAAEPENGGLPAAELDVGDEAEEDIGFEEHVAVGRAAREKTAAESPTRHIQRDYSYVRAEVFRILMVAAFLIISLTITAILRN